MILGNHLNKLYLQGLTTLLLLLQLRLRILNMKSRDVSLSAHHTVFMETVWTSQEYVSPKRSLTFDHLNFIQNSSDPQVLNIDFWKDYHPGNRMTILYK